MANPVKPLFPIVNNDDSTTGGSTTLFPVSSVNASDSNEQQNATNLDWLENKSYLPTVIRLAETGQVSSAGSPNGSEWHSSGERQSGWDSSKFKERKVGDRGFKRDSSPPQAEDQCIFFDKKKKSSHKEKKHKKKRHKQEKSRNASSVEDIRQETKVDEFWKKHRGKTFLEEIPGLDPENAFRVDRTKDKALWDYDSIYKDRIARYTRFVSACLGNPAITVASKKVDSGKNQMPDRYYLKDNRKSSRVKGQMVRSSEAKNFKGSEYISVKDKDKQILKAAEHCRITDPFNILDSSTNLYVQGQGKSLDQNASDSVLFMDETFEKISSYNRRLTEDPSNVKLWLEFVSFQDVVFQNAKFSSQQASSRRLRDVFQPPRACIEKKLAILDKALDANPSSQQLKMTKLELQQDVADSETLAKEWDKLLFSHSGDVHLWRHYLIFQQSRLSTFTVGHTVKLYHRCFRTLRPIMEGHVKVVKMMENLEDEMIELFAQYCTLLHQCGFTEKAVASYQALIEFNLFRPPSLNLEPTTDCINIFESFWDSGVSRFGEPGARGWAAWVDGQRHLDSSCVSVIQVNTDQEQEDILAQNSSVYETWIKLEQLRESAHWLPWRPDVSSGETEEDCEDLDRLVLYDDIAPILFRVQKSSSCSRIVVLFLEFLELGFTRDGHHHSSSNRDFEQMNLHALHQIPAASGFDIGLTADSVWKPRPEVTAFIEEVLRQAVAYFSGLYRSLFAVCLFRLQQAKAGIRDISALSSEAVKGIRRYGKNLLKELQNRNDLTLWNEYIRTEWAFGKTDDALAMLQTALCMFSSSTAFDDHNAMAGLCSLYRTFAEIQLNFLPLDLVQAEVRKASSSETCKQKVMFAFFCLTDGTMFSPQKQGTLQPPQVLRTRKKFQSMAAGLVAREETVTNAASKKYLIEMTCCSSLFELCSTGLESALQVFDSVIKQCQAVFSNIDSSSQTKQAVTDLHELLSVEQILMLKKYMAVEFVSLTTIRSRLQVALSCFPNNTWLLRELIDMEARSHMAGRVRRYFEIAARDTATPYPVLFEALGEMSRHVKVSGTAFKPEVSDTGTVHRVRAAFERGLQHRATRHCPLLWRLYLNFEATCGSQEKARGILYRALQTCPWAKVLYLDGAVIFGPSQVQELIDLLIEKEIRLQIPLEEVSLLLNSEPQTS